VRAISKLWPPAGTAVVPISGRETSDLAETCFVTSSGDEG
jgi:hypothetical protein